MLVVIFLANTLDLYVIRIFSEKFEIRGRRDASATIFLVIKRRSMTVVLLRIEDDDEIYKYSAATGPLFVALKLLFLISILTHRRLQHLYQKFIKHTL